MKLVHFCSEPIEDLQPRKYCQSWLSWQAKPNGLWVSDEDEDEDGWKGWSEANDFRVECLVVAYEVTLKPDANILILDSKEKVFEMSEKYPLKTRHFDSEFDTYQLDWNKVKSKYQGIIITPYRNDCRLELETCWYYGWDCASGCIWDINCIKEFKRIENGLDKS